MMPIGWPLGANDAGRRPMAALPRARSAHFYASSFAGESLSAGATKKRADAMPPPRRAYLSLRATPRESLNAADARQEAPTRPVLSAGSRP